MSSQLSEYAWMNGGFVPWADATVHVLTPTLQYGWGVFEGIRCYSTEAGPALFRPVEHLDRLVRSAKLYHMSLPNTVSELLKASQAAVTVNGFENCYVRPIVYLGHGEVGLNHLHSESQVAIAAWAWDDYLGAHAAMKGCRVCTASWRHVGPNEIPPTGKGTGLYVNSSLAKMAAVLAGYDDALMLNMSGNVVQATAENVFAVYGNTLITPPTSEGLLSGITRDTIMTLARDREYAVMQQPIARTGVYFADEVFLTGTAAEVVPVVEADDRPIGTGRPGPVTQRLVADYRDVTRGQLPVYKSWNVYLTS